MNLLQKNSLSVVVATLVASVLILSAGKGVADNNADISVTTENESIKAIKTESIGSEAIVNKLNTLPTNSSNSTNRKAHQIPPPPGPFFGDESIKEAQKRILVSPKLPIVPSAPVSRKFVVSPPVKKMRPEVKEPSLGKPPEIFKPKIPSLEIDVAPTVVAPKMPKNTLTAPTIETPKMKKPLLEPSLSKPAPVIETKVNSKPNIQKPIGKAPMPEPSLSKPAPVIESKMDGKPNIQKPVGKAPVPEPSLNKLAPVMETKINKEPKFQKQIGKPPALNQQPIWMQKAPKKPVNKNQQPKLQYNGSSLKNNFNYEQNGMSHPQNYMFMPAPIFTPNYGYPQAPINGGGYYYSPSPQQFMPPPMNYGMPMNQQQQPSYNKEINK